MDTYDIFFINLHIYFDIFSSNSFRFRFKPVILKRRVLVDIIGPSPSLVSPPERLNAKRNSAFQLDLNLERKETEQI